MTKGGRNARILRMERINVQRSEFGIKNPFFAKRNEDFIEGQIVEEEVVKVDEMPVELIMSNIGNFELRSVKKLEVLGEYRRAGRSIKVKTPTTDNEEVLPEKYQFTITKDNWAQFTSWDGQVVAKLTMLEDLPIAAGVLASSLEPNPTLEVSVRRDFPRGTQPSESAKKVLVRS